MLEEITNPPWLREGHGPVPEKGRRGYSGKLGEESAIIQGIRRRVFDGSSGSPEGKGSRKRAHESLRFGVFASAEDMGWAWGYVAQTLKPSEWSKIPDALKAVMEECTKFRDKGAWIEEDVMELSEVCRLAKKKREEEGRPNDPGPLRGKIFPLGGVKNSEQAELRKYKGGVAFFQGSWITNEYGLQAEFPDQGSGASFTTASRVMDAVAMLPACSGQQSDAPQAYTQCKLGTGLEESHRETWVRLPADVWPDHWHGKYRDHVCPHHLALCGHPLSVTCWKNAATKHLLLSADSRRLSVGIASMSNVICKFSCRSTWATSSWQGRLKTLPKLGS